MLDTNQFEKDLETLTSYSKNIKGKKAGLEAVIHHSYFLLSTAQLHKRARPFGKMECVTDYSLIDVFRKDEREFELLCKATTSLFEIYANNAPFTDVLTELYGQYLGYDKGQHMTPPDLADLLATISLGEISKKFDGENSILIGDPTGCGTGATILASIRYVYNTHGPELLRYCNFIGVELDRTLSMATVVQVELGSILHNVQFNRFEIYNANAITEYMDDRTLLYGAVPNQLRYKMSRHDNIQKAA